MKVVLSHAHREVLLDHARAAAPEECCGVLMGVSAVGRIEIHEVHAVPNAWEGDRSHRYELDARAQLRLQRDARGREIDIVGYYHSHPDASAVPSKFDTSRAWPDVLYVIVSLEPTQDRPIRGWFLDETSCAWSEMELEFDPD